MGLIENTFRLLVLVTKLCHSLPIASVFRCLLPCSSLSFLWSNLISLYWHWKKLTKAVPPIAALSNLWWKSFARDLQIIYWLICLETFFSQSLLWLGISRFTQSKQLQSYSSVVGCNIDSIGFCRWCYLGLSRYYCSNMVISRNVVSFRSHAYVSCLFPLLN